LPVVHKIGELYREIYLAALQAPKKDKLGFYVKIENICLDILTALISASLENKNNKLQYLNSARLNTEVLKRLLRLAYELKIISFKNYLRWETKLQEISKMINGWIKYAGG
jgi:four helix bundle protein